MTEDPGTGILCPQLTEYPVTIKERDTIEVADSEEELPSALSAWCERFYFAQFQRPGVTLHPRALKRIYPHGCERRRWLCTRSWPVDPMARIVLEQCVLDTSGMMVRYLYNELPWILQPALYTDCFLKIQEARGIASDYTKGQKESKDGGR